MAGLSGQTSFKRTFSLTQMKNEIVQIYRKSFQDAVMIETNAMKTDLSKALRNATFQNVYSYPSTNPNRRYYHGGIADPQFYEFEAVVRSSDDIEIVFFQDEFIPHESFDGSDDDTHGGFNEYDTRRIVEEEDAEIRKKWKQPKARPYFDDVARLLSQRLPENINSRIHKSMRMRGM
jgi:hypothetical protein